MKRFTTLAILFIAFILSNAVSASTLSTSQATETIFNFDFSGQTPSPPYATFLLGFNVTSAAPNSQLWYDVYEGLNGSSLLYSNWLSPSVGTTGTTTPPSLNGVFSVGVYSQVGNIDLTSLSAQGFSTAGPSTATLFGTQVITSVPEPSEWLLMFCGLGLIGFISYHRKNNSSVMSTAA